MPPSTRRLQRKTQVPETHSDAICTNTDKPFPFLDLPETVRQRFYELQLEAPRRFVRTFGKVLPLHSRATPAKVKINILFTCRQIYQEAMPVLYRVNRFCVAPLSTSPDDALTESGDVKSHLEYPQNDRWIHNMPLRGRNLIRTLELWLPLPPTNGKHPNWQDMRDLFPGLRSLTLFIDIYNQLDRPSWHGIALPFEHCELYFQRMLEKTPQARQTFVDLQSLETNPHELGLNYMTDLILKLWNASPGKSAHVSQEIHHAAKYEEQMKLVDKGLLDVFGPRALVFQGKSYWHIRRNFVMNHDTSLTDDDTDDEIECFENFDAEKIVARRRRKVESIEQGSFDFEEDEGTWW
ncbi:hypothetical protein E4T38_06402 [Aureobasidium subglaciale]|nr:hypothetical protein E4T38_06402 [Aureobasidium subglaciale]KAI5219467.1 hypothetical protein E4T40_06346 [Aureobasidium subglaciale]KAI5223191.1 hypothetical protein E4T41_06186 [Aureobasidium subglaciale]KAI5259777.1 hypothetical protein E4T46_06621 [Aureobasidium subglaciale]